MNHGAISRGRFTPRNRALISAGVLVVLAVAHAAMPATATAKGRDRTPPVTRSSVVSGWTRASSVTLKAADKGGVRRTYYRVGSGKTTTYRRPIALSEGSTVIRFWSVDKAGNAEKPKTLRINGDRAAPQTTISGVVTGWTSDPQTFALSALDARSGIVGTYYRSGSDAAKSYSGPVTISANGVTDIQYWSVDAAGNAEAPRSASVAIDNVAPTTVVIGQPKTTVAAGPVTLKLLAADEGAGVSATYYSVNGAQARTYTADQTGIVIDSPGQTSIAVWSVDALGLAETPRLASVGITYFDPDSRNPDCLGCHSSASVPAVSRVDFRVGGVDRSTSCPKCHPDGLLGTHPYHNATANCGAICHAGWGAALPTAEPSIVTTYGAFASASSAVLSSDQLHVIHSQARWPANVDYPDSRCASCHAAAACVACHDSAEYPVTAQHASHSAAGNAHYAAQPSVLRTVGHGVPLGDQSVLSVQTGAEQCSTPSCHNTAGLSTFNATFYEDFSHDADPASALGANTVTTTGTWKTIYGMDYSAGRMLRSSGAGARFSAKVQGRAVSWVSETGPDKGIADVYLDGAKVATVDCYAPSRTAGQTVWQSSTLSAGSHDVTVTVTGTRNASAAAAYIVVDRLCAWTNLAGKVAPLCTDCHSDKTDPHGYESATHAAVYGASVEPTSGVACAKCHSTDLYAEHTRTGASSAGAECSNCHPDPRQTFGAWNKTCSQVGCHPAGTAQTTHGRYAAQHAMPSGTPTSCLATGCHGPAGDIAALHANASTVTAGVTRTSCLVCHSATSLPTSSQCDSCHANLVDPHPDSAAKHTGNGYDWIGATHGDSVYLACSDCHSTSILPLHANYCDACHGATAPAQVKAAVANHSTACTACHPGPHYDVTAHDSFGYGDCGPCHGSGCTQCHPAWTPVPKPTTVSDGKTSYISTATITLTANDAVHGSFGLKGTFYNLDGSGDVAGTQVVIPAPASGTQSHTLTFWSTDYSGNVEIPNVLVFTVSHDSFAPVTGTSIVPGKLYTGDQSFTLSPVDANSTVAGTWWQLDSTTGAWSSGTSVPVAAPVSGKASHTLYYYSADSWCNTETVKSVAFSVVPGKEFVYTGATQSFVVPSGVTTVGVIMNGASGGDDYLTSYYGPMYGLGGAGGTVIATLPVAPLSTLTVYVGGRGGSAYFQSAGGWSNGGGVTGYEAGGGGGSTSIWNGLTELAEAGGGGGAGYYYVGCNGGSGGATGTPGGGFRTGASSTFSYAGSGGGGWNAGVGGVAAYRGGTGGTSYIASGVGTTTVGTNLGTGTVTIRYSLGSIASTYTLGYAAGANGTLSGVASQSVAAGSSGTTVTAVADPHYHFVNWSDGGVANPRRDTNVYSNVNVVANFAVDVYSLSYAAGANGTVSGVASQTVAYNSSATTVTALPATGYHFTGWSDGVLTAVRQDTAVSANKSVTANFAIDTFTLNYAAGANGTIGGVSVQTVNYGASGTTVTAVPNSGHHFVNWSDGSAVNPRREINVTANKSVTANFAVNMVVTLSYTAGAHGSIVGSATQAVVTGDSGSAVTAVPDVGYHFVNWSDGGTSNPRTDVSVLASITATANFAIDTFTVNYLTGPNGTLSGVASQTVNYGASSTPVTAIGNSGYHFVKWSDESTANPRAEANVTANRSAMALFGLDGGYTLTYAPGANGSLLGTTTQTGIDYGRAGTAVTAIPNTGYRFVNWSDGSGANPRVDTNVISNKSVTANFALLQFTIYSTYYAGGTLSPLGNTVLNYGASQTYTATPNTGYRTACFMTDYDYVNGWRLPSATYTFSNVTAGHSIYAYFASSGTRTIVYTYGVNGYTSVYTTPQYVALGGTGPAVTAIGNYGYHFTNWSDGSTANPRQDTNVTADKIVTPVFALNTYTLSYVAGSNGTLVGAASQPLLYGSTGTTVTAVPDAGYRFISWSDGSTSPSRADYAGADKSVTANFAPSSTVRLVYLVDGPGALSGATVQSLTPGASGTTVTATWDGYYYQFDGWSDGLLETARQEMNVSADATITARFSQWYFGSCPFLYTWDGSRFQFEADMFTTGKLASQRANGVYQKPNPNDYYVIEATPAAKGGQLEAKLVEERFETDYLDQLKLYSIDVPADRDIAAKKIPQGGAFQPLSEVVHTVSSALTTLPATQRTTGLDVSAKIGKTDGSCVVLSADQEHPAYDSVELDLGDLNGAEAVKLVVEGATRFPKTEAGKSLGTAGVRQKVEVIGADGKWTALPGEWPKPAEFGRPYLLDLSGRFPTADHRVRLTFLLKTYIDSVRLDTTADLPILASEVRLSTAQLGHHGLDPLKPFGDLLQFNYGPAVDFNGYLAGRYTKFGDVAPLLLDLDDKFVIFGGGDELTLRFDQPAAPPAGMKRRYVLYTNGYYKDLNTDVAHTVDPLPFAAMSNYPYGPSESYPSDAGHRSYVDEWNTRYEPGN